MQNLVFIRTHNYNDTLVGEQLVKEMEKSVYLNGDWLCFSSPMVYNDTTVNMTLDSMAYVINNYIFSRTYDNIIIGWNFENNEMIYSLINHLENTANLQINIFMMTDTGDVRDVENFELKNRQYASDYFTIQPSKQLVKISCIDTTGISAFKIAKICEEAITK